MKGNTAASAGRSYIGARSRAEGAGFEAHHQLRLRLLPRNRAGRHRENPGANEAPRWCRSIRQIPRLLHQASPTRLQRRSLRRKSGRFRGEAHRHRSFVVRPRISRASRLFAPDITAGRYRVRSVFIQWPGVLPHSVADLGRHEERVWPEVHHPGGFGRVPYPRCSARSVAFFGGS